MSATQDINPNRIESLILTVRGLRVMMDSDLARIYGVSTKHLNQQFRRNRTRFPEDFAFQLAPTEFTGMRSQFVTASKRNLRHPPILFTEHGAVMLAMVLKSPSAAQASVLIVRAFFHLREQMVANHELARTVAELESRMDSHDESIAALFEAIRGLIQPSSNEEPMREIGFHIREEAPPYRVRLSRRR